MAILTPRQVPSSWQGVLQLWWLEPLHHPVSTKPKTTSPLLQQQNQIAQTIRQITQRETVPDITDPAPGTNQAAPLADTPAIPKAEALPTALPLDVPTDLPDGIEDQPPSGTIKTALR